jgi:hypothetical protein
MAAVELVSMVGGVTVEHRDAESRELEEPGPAARRRFRKGSRQEVSAGLSHFGGLGGQGSVGVVAHVLGSKLSSEASR